MNDLKDRVDPRTGERTPLYPVAPAQIPQYPAHGTYQYPQAYPSHTPVEAPQYMAFKSKGREFYCAPNLVNASAGEVVSNFCPSLQDGSEYIPVKNPFTKVVEISPKMTAFCKAGKMVNKRQIDVSATVPEGGLDCVLAEWSPQ